MNSDPGFVQETPPGRGLGEVGRGRVALTLCLPPGGHGQGQRHPPLQGGQRPPGAGALPGPREARLRQPELPTDHGVQVRTRVPSPLQSAPHPSTFPPASSAARSCRAALVLLLPTPHPQHTHTHTHTHMLSQGGGWGQERWSWRKGGRQTHREMTPHYYKMNGQLAPGQEPLLQWR